AAAQRCVSHQPKSVEEPDFPKLRTEYPGVSILGTRSHEGKTGVAYLNGLVFRAVVVIVPIKELVDHWKQHRTIDLCFVNEAFHLVQVNDQRAVRATLNFPTEPFSAADAEDYRGFLVRLEAAEEFVRLGECG